MPERKITLECIKDFTELGEKIRKKYEDALLEFGDPDVVKYNEFVRSYRPLSFDELLDFAGEVIKEYELLLKEGDEELRFKLKDAEEKLKDIAKAVKPYLPKTEQ